MAELVTITEIKYLDKEEIEEVRGYDRVQIDSPGLIIFVWEEADEALIIPHRRIEYMMSKVERPEE